MGNSKKDTEIRDHFEGGEYGWPRDAVNGAIQVLLVAGGRVRIADGTGPQELGNKAIGQTEFRAGFTTVSTGERIQVREILQKLGV